MLSLSLSTMWRHKKLAVCKPRRKLSPEPTMLVPLSQTSSLSNCEDRNVCCLSHPVFDTLFWQLELTNIIPFPSWVFIWDLSTRWHLSWRLVREPEAEDAEDPTLDPRSSDTVRSMCMFLCYIFYLAINNWHSHTTHKCFSWFQIRWTWSQNALIFALIHTAFHVFFLPFPQTTNTGTYRAETVWCCSFSCCPVHQG